eukprot:4157022-Lingulodinium_polyedra.AAC.1
MLRFLGPRATTGLPCTPNMHALGVLPLRIRAKRFGNPLRVATWDDENLNSDFAMYALLL